MDLSKIKKIYMIGIKGVGMTMLGQFLAEKGFAISGSDTAEKFMTEKALKKAGIHVIENFNEKNLPSDADLIIHSLAYNPENNAEVAKARAGKTKVLNYGEAAGEFFNEYYGIAVSGSHGKTTTTAWLGYVLWKAGLNPNVMAGSHVPQFGGTSLSGASDYLVAEVDEYGNKFQHYRPRAILLNNIDYDHPDFFPTVEAYEKVFIEFIKKIPKKGFLAANFDDPVVRKIARVNCLGKVISYGLNDPEADYIASEITQKGDRQFFRVKMQGDDLGAFSIRLSGRHNVLNALAVIAASVELEAPLAEARVALAEFTGTDRRMEFLGEYNGARIYDDYAHHPTEIKTTLEGARVAYPDKRLIVVFHPHTFTRTIALLEDFAKSFAPADELIILDIYGSAREKQGGIHSRDLVEKINETNRRSGREQDVRHIATLAECEEYLRDRLTRGDLCLLMGAGDVFRIGENLIKNT
ncbi:MAG: UDP-N-acetylmuramate--L-alanine ligase [Patescibacteria group bacterium]|jgi:UDP-N-acetylmuramate--alanine ligase